MEKRKLKIVLVSQEYPPETARGGIGSQTYAKAHGLVDLGHEVFVISRSTNSRRIETKNGQLTIIRIPGMEHQIPDMTEIVQWITHSAVVAAEIETLRERVQLDIIDFPEWAAEGYTYLLNRTAWNTIPTVIQLHGSLAMFSDVMNWPEKNSVFYEVGTHMESTCTKLADAVYTSSKCSADWVNKYYDPGKTDIPVIHLGVDTSLFAPQQVPKHEFPTIIFVGKIVPNKGIIELVEASIEVVKKIPGLKLRIIGTGDPKLINDLESKAVDSGAINLLEFAGYIHKEALPEELSKAHVFALPSYYEGGPGFVFLEAMACGLPVIGCSGSGVEEIVIPGETGILVPPKNIKALQKSIEKILGDSNLSGAMAANARNYILELADSSKCINQLEAFYDSVISKIETANSNEKFTTA